MHCGLFEMVEMISLLIVLSLLILSFGLLLKFKSRGIAASVGLIGSDTDSAGIMYWLTSYYSKYKMPIRLLIVFATLVSMYRLFKNDLMRKKNKDFFIYYFWPLIALSCIILGSALFRGQGVVIGLSELIWLGVPFSFFGLQVRFVIKLIICFSFCVNPRNNSYVGDPWWINHCGYQRSFHMQVKLVEKGGLLIQEIRSMCQSLFEFQQT
ncbi:MAG: hypothetical protein IPN91_10805 [Holophagaceae bacterium]|uniref:Uncharacterized protein n=1 Tax=Candidatus Geothrix odensensis TaxID=2954440 RepID=A0A936F2U9_9BACT|nr:hypothetical protein [Candidatus Geothrix odensensis]